MHSACATRLFVSKSHLIAISKFSARSTQNFFLGGITLVALYSVITAGPRKVCPATKSPRS